jgi:hypothetical protein
MIERQLGSTLSSQAKTVMQNMYANKVGIVVGKSGAITYSPQIIKELYQRDPDAFRGMMNNLERETVKNSNNYLQPLGAFEKIVGEMLQPKKIPFGVSYTFEGGVLKEADVTIEDIIKPHRALTIEGRMTKFKAPLTDYSNWNLALQTGMNPNPYDARNQQPVFGDTEYIETPVVSYSGNFVYTKNEEAVMRAHNFLGQQINISWKHNKFLEYFEEQYQYDMVRTSDILLQDRTLLDQEGETAINNLGIPNNVNGIADATLTMNQLQDLLFKIVEIANNKNGSIRGGITNKINEFLIPLANAIKLKSNTAVHVGDALNNLAFQSNTIQNRLQYVVNFFAGHGIKVIASNQLNPSSNVGIYDTAIAATMNPANAILPRNRNTVDRPFYLLTNDNSGADQEILFAEKMNFMTTSFVPNDPLGESQIMGKTDLFSGIRYMRPALNRALITTNA